VTHPAHFGDLYTNPNQPPKPPGTFDDLYEVAAQPELSLSDQISQLLTRMPLGPLPSSIIDFTQSAPGPIQPPTLGPAPSQFHQAVSDIVGMGKEFLAHPAATIYGMIGAPFVKTLSQTESQEDRNTAMLAEAFPASQLDNPDIRALVSRHEDLVDARRASVALVASSLIGGAAGDMMANGLRAMRLPEAAATLGGHIGGAGVGGAAYPLFAEKETPSLARLAVFGLAAAGPAAIFTLGKMTGSNIPDVTDPVGRAKFLDMARRGDPFVVGDEPPPAGKPVEGEPSENISTPMAQAEQAATKLENMTPLEGTEGRGIEVTGVRATPEIPPKTPTLAVMTGMANLQAQPSVFDKFYSRFRDIDEHPENYSTNVPDISDIKEKYPQGYYHAMEYDNPQDAMYEFANSLSDMVENREITPEIAQSVGGRFEAYLKARSSVLLANSFDARVRLFARENGYTEAEFPALWKHLASQLGEHLRQLHMEPEDYALYHEVSAKLKQVPLSDVDGAGIDGAMVSREGGGYTIRDAKRDAVLAIVDDPAGVQEFLDNSGTADGPSGDGAGINNSVPPSAIAGDAMPPSPPPPSTKEFNRAGDELAMPYNVKDGWLQKIFDAWRATFPRLNRMEAVLSAIDNKFGTKFTEKAFYPLQKAKQRMLALMDPHLNTIHEASKLIPLKSALWDKVGEAVETMSPEELRGGKGFGRAFNDNEINMANWMAAKQIDLPRVLEYTRLADEIRDNVKGPEAQSQIQQLIDSYGFDADHRSAANIVGIVRKMHINEASLGMITRLADAIMRDTPSRSEFMARNNFTPAMRKAVFMVDDYFNTFKNQTGIDPLQIINNYLPHYRAGGNAPTLGAAFFFQKGLEASREYQFASEMIRTGEIDAYEKHPILAMVRYARGFFNSREFQPVYQQALKDALEEFNKIPRNAQRQTKAVWDAYMQQISGRPDAAVQFTQEVTNRLFDEMKINVPPSVRGDVVDTLTSLFYAGGIGFRPQIMLRHLNQMLSLGFARFGRIGRLASAVSNISPGMWDRIAELKAKGVFPTIASPLIDSVEESPAWLAGLQGAGTLSRRIAEAGMRVNGLKSVYEMSHYIWYEEARARALKWLPQIGKEGVTKQMAYDRLDLDTYKPAFRGAFDTLVKQGKIDEAADLIGRQTGREITFVYGLANHPMGWGTNVMRLFGMYGVWPTWMQDYTYDMLGTGKLSSRVRRIAAFAMAQGATWMTGKMAGLDMSPFFMGPGFFYNGNIGQGIMETASPTAMWFGGPMMGMLSTGIDAVKNPNPALRRYSRKRFMNMLTLPIPGRGLIQDVQQASKVTEDPRFDDLLHFWARVAGVKPEDLNSWMR
jgi:hypothetical protein